MIRIFLPCLWNLRTGGPEAVHQLSDALLSQGFDARLVYYTEVDLLQKMAQIDVQSYAITGYAEHWSIPAEFPERENQIEDYAHYRTELARALPDEEGAVIVLPETLCHFASWFKRAKVLIWWLSVDNAFTALGRFNVNHLRAANVYHATQSQYAARFIDALQFPSLGMLSDYTVDLTHYARPLPWDERPKLVAIATGRKVIADLDAIVARIQERDPEIECVKIANFSRLQMADLFAKARAYVDLGNFPGKDRGPREAMAMGCVALAGHAGASDETGAFVVGSTEPEAIAEHVVMHMRGEPQFFAAPEREIFYKEAANVFAQL